MHDVNEVHTFATTQRSVVLAAVGDPQDMEPWETLCARYWYPSYAFIRRNGHGPQDAQDQAPLPTFRALPCQRPGCRSPAVRTASHQARHHGSGTRNTLGR